MLDWIAPVQREERKAQTADGRTLQILLAGPPATDHVFYLHGTPGVLGTYEPQIEEGVRRGLRHVFYLRPGYGGSDRQPDGRSRTARPTWGRSRTSWGSRRST